MKVRLIAAMLSMLFFSYQIVYSQDNSGEILGTYHDVPVYSNGINTGTGNGDIEYQCVAFMKRFYNDFIQNPITITGNANTYFDNLPGIGFISSSQDGTVPQTALIVSCF